MSYELTNTAIFSVLADLASGAISRRDASQWADDIRDECSISTPGGAQFRFPTKIKYWDDAWVAISCALLNEDCDYGGSDGPPYFMRLDHYAEWLAILRDEPALATPNSPVKGLRSNQLPAFHFEAVMQFVLPYEEIVRRLGIRDIRGCDELDYYRALIFETDWQAQFMIENRPYPDPEKSLILVNHLQAEVWPESVERLLGLMGLTMDDVTWQTDYEEKLAFFDWTQSIMKSPKGNHV